MSAAAIALGYRSLAMDLPWFRALVEDSPAPGISGPEGRWLLVVLAVVAAPLAEEFLFRGMVFRSLRRILPLAPSVLASAAVFAVVHPPASWVPVFVLGAMAAVAFDRTRLLMTPICAHAVYNAALVFSEW